MESKVAPGGDAVITIGDMNIKLPILKGTVGPDVVDIRKLYGEADVFTYDPAFTSTASCESQITISTATPASCSIVAIRSSSWPKTPASWRSAICF